MASEFVTNDKCDKHIDKMSDKIDKLGGKFDDFKDDISNKITSLEITIAGLPEKMVKRNDEKYASKLTQKIVYGMVAFILMAVLSAIIYLVIKK